MSGTFVEQFFTASLSHAAYIIVSGTDAAVVDPLRDTTRYLEIAGSHGATIKYVLQTELRNEYQSGHEALAVATGATVVHGPLGKSAVAPEATEYKMKLCADGDTIKLGGGATIRVLSTPGVSPSATSYLLLGAADQFPERVFVGRTLSVDGVPTPEPAPGFTAEHLTRSLFRSLRDKIMALPDPVLIHPAHGVSLVGGRATAVPWDSVGHQVLSNYALQRDTSEADFIDLLLDGMPPQALDAEADEAAGFTAAHARGMHPVSVDELAAHATRGCLILDVRKHYMEFCKAHVPGSVFAGTGGSLAMWVAAIVEDRSQPYMLVSEDLNAIEAIGLLMRNGFDNCLGHLEGGFPAWKASDRATATIPLLSAVDYVAELRKGAKRALVDVRGKDEWISGHLSHARHEPMAGRRPAAPPIDFKNVFADATAESPCILLCAAGFRSTIYASLALRAGVPDEAIVQVNGGFRAMKTQATSDDIAALAPLMQLGEAGLSDACPSSESDLTADESMQPQPLMSGSMVAPSFRRVRSGTNVASNNASLTTSTSGAAPSAADDIGRSADSGSGGDDDDNDAGDDGKGRVARGAATKDVDDSGDDSSALQPPPKHIAIRRKITEERDNARQALPYAEDDLQNAVDDGLQALVEQLTARFGESARDAACRAITERVRLQAVPPEVATMTNDGNSTHLSTAEYALATAGSHWLDGAELERLKTLDVFVLDNSLRETTVAALHAHNLANKQEIMKHILRTGLNEIIVGTFGEVHNVDDALPYHFMMWGFGSLESCWGLTDALICTADGVAQAKTGKILSAGLDEVVEYRLGNVVLEVNTCSPVDYSDFDIGSYMVKVVREAKRRMPTRRPRRDEDIPAGLELDAKGRMPARVLINLRDFTAWPTNPAGHRRALDIVKAVALLPPNERPLGLIFEEPSGLLLPQTIAAYTRTIREVMNACGWMDGRLLIHVHSAFGNAMGGMLKALANGADGIWGAVCSYGAQLGHASSAVALVNLARLGNEYAGTRYNIPGIVKAARGVHEITSMEKVDPLEEVYGSQAFDMVFGDGPMSSDVEMRRIGGEICGQQCFVRVSTFSPPSMIEQALEQRFGPASEVGWDPRRTEKMFKIVNESLLNGLRWEYNTDIGLCTLYEMSAPENEPQGFASLPPKMVEQVLGNELARHPLLVEFKRRLWNVLRMERQERSGVPVAGRKPALFKFDVIPDDDDMPNAPTSLIVDALTELVSDVSERGGVFDAEDDEQLKVIRDRVWKVFPEGMQKEIPFKCLKYMLLWPLKQQGGDSATSFRTVEELLVAAHRTLFQKITDKAEPDRKAPTKRSKYWNSVVANVRLKAALSTGSGAVGTISAEAGRKRKESMAMSRSVKKEGGGSATHHQDPAAGVAAANPDDDLLLVQPSVNFVHRVDHAKGY